MENHRPVAELDKWLRESEGLTLALLSVQGAPRAIQSEGLTKGRRRVPKPPTRMRAVEHFRQPTDCSFVVIANLPFISNDYRLVNRGTGYLTKW